MVPRDAIEQYLIGAAASHPENAKLATLVDQVISNTATGSGLGTLDALAMTCGGHVGTYLAALVLWLQNGAIPSAAPSWWLSSGITL